MFTDVEGSTALWEQHGSGFKAVLNVHDDTMRAAILRHRGYEVKTEGDAFMVAFVAPTDAVRWCVDVQKALTTAAWPGFLANVAPQGLRVRMGVHWGAPLCVADPTTGRMDYFGPMVNRAARVSSAGHGGQVLVSDAAWNAAESQPDWLVKILGEFVLPGLREPELIRQVLPATLSGRTFPPIRARAARRTNVTPAESPMLGRDKECADLLDGLSIPGVRVVSGPPGVGSSRLLHELVVLGCTRLEGGAWWVDAHGATDAAEVAARIAAALGIGASDTEPVRQVGHVLAARGATLVVLDGVDPRWRGAASVVKEWAKAAPELRLILGARVRGGLPLARATALGPLSTASARALFRTHALAADPGFKAATAELDDLVEALDCLPLALVLAAPRLRVLSLADLRRRLDARFSVLRGTGPDGLGRSLGGALAEAWDLLAPEERDVLAQCSLFEGPFSLSDAESLVDLSAHPEGASPLDALTALLDHSLLRAEGEQFTTLQTVRAYAQTRQSTQPEVYLRLAEARCALATPEAIDALQKVGLSGVSSALVDVLPDLRAVCAHAPHWTPAVSACARAAARLLHLRGPLAAVTPLLERVAELPEIPPSEAGLLLAEAAEVSLGFGARKAVEGLLARAVDFAAMGGDAALRGYIVGLRGIVALQVGQIAESFALLEAAIAVAVRFGDRRAAGLWAGHLGVLTRERGDLAGSARWFEMALRDVRSAGDRRIETQWIGNLGYLQRDTNDPSAARRTYTQAYQLARTLGDRRAEGLWLGNLGDILKDLGSLERAEAVTEEALALVRDVGDRKREGVWLGNMGDIQRAGGTTQRRQRRMVSPSGCWTRSGRLPRGSSAFTWRRASLRWGTGPRRARCSRRQMSVFVGSMPPSLRTWHACSSGSHAGWVTSKSRQSGHGSPRPP